MTARLSTRVATTLLALFIPHQDVEVLIGDLEEERTFGASASRWYWSQVLRSIPEAVWLTILRGGWKATCGVAAAACVMQVAVELITGFAVYYLTPIGALWPSITAGAITLASLAFVSFKASQIRRGAAAILALIAMCAIMAQLMLAIQVRQELPGGMAAALVAVPGVVLVGGLMSSRPRKRC
jgi:hypothetical protein